MLDCKMDHRRGQFPENMRARENIHPHQLLSSSRKEVRRTSEWSVVTSQTVCSCQAAFSLGTREVFDHDGLTSSCRRSEQHGKKESDGELARCSMTARYDGEVGQVPGSAFEVVVAR